MQRKRLKRIEKDEKGAIGIGTMIVFVGMLIVAAVAVTVILNTSDQLRETAEETGDDTAERIVPPVEVTRVEGNVSEETQQVVDLATYMRIPEGRDAYNIEDNLVIKVDGVDGGEHAFSRSFVYNGSDAATDYPVYHAEVITNTTHSELPIVSSGSLIRIDIRGIDMDEAQLGDGGLSPGSDINFEFMTTFGGSGTRRSYSTPYEYPVDGWIRL